MSFKTNINYKGIEVQDAFFNIKAVIGTKERKIIELQCYANEELYSQDKENRSSENCLFANTDNIFAPDYSEGSVNEHRQAYNYLRENVYIDATDC